jgi:hypothetical protein
MKTRTSLLLAGLTLGLVLGSAVPGYALIALDLYYSQAPSIQGGTFNNTPPGPLGGGNNLSVTGDFGFTATGGPVTISYAVDLVFPAFILQPGLYVVGGGIQGYFATETPGHQIFLTGYTADTFVVGAPGSDVTVSMPTGGLSVVLPYVTPGSFQLSDPPSLLEQNFAISPPFLLNPTVSVDLRQVLTVTFSGLQQGDVVDVQFPNTASVTPANAVPEPTGLTLGLVSCIVLVGGGSWRKSRAHVKGDANH